MIEANPSSSGATLNATEEFFLVAGGRYVATAGLASGSLGTATLQYLDASDAWVAYPNSDGTLPFEGLINVPESGYVRWEISGGSSPVVDVDFVQQATNTGDEVPSDSPTFTGTPTAPTADVQDDSTQIATTAFVKDVAVPVPWAIPDMAAFWDLNHVTLATLKVTAMADLTGNGHSLSNGTTAQQGDWTERGIDLKGSGYAIDGGGITGLDFRSMTIGVIMRTYVGSSTFGSPAGMLWQIGATNPGIYLDAYNSYEYGQNSHYVLPFAFHPSGGPSIYAACYGSADVTYYNNCGRQVATVATAGTGTLSRMFSTAASGSGSVLGMVAAFVARRKLTEAEIRQIANYYGVQTATSIPHMKVMGSSTPAGYLATSYQASVIPKLVAKLGWQMSATGTNGLTMATQAGTAQAAMVPTPGQANRWLVFLTSNDIASAAPTTAVATYQTNVTTHLTRIRAADPTGLIIVVDMPPRKGTMTNTEAGYETDRQTINSWANTNKATLGIDILVSYNDNANIGQQADADNTTYYNADKIHLTDLGHTELCNLIASKILGY